MFMFIRKRLVVMAGTVKIQKTCLFSNRKKRMQKQRKNVLSRREKVLNCVNSFVERRMQTREQMSLQACMRSSMMDFVDPKKIAFNYYGLCKKKHVEKRRSKSEKWLHKFLQKK